MSLREWFLALPTGVAVGGGSYVLLTPDAILALGLAVVYASMGWLVVRHWALLTGGEQGPDGAKWSSAAVALSLFAALFGPHHGLALPSATVFALQLLVVGLAWTMLLLGVAWARAIAPDGTTRAVPADD